MAAKKISVKPQVARTEQVASNAKAASKQAGEDAVAKKADTGPRAPRKADVSISPKPAATCAAEVETNLGGSRPLTDFLSEIDWYE